jgi:hypothetical protein
MATYHLSFRSCERISPHVRVQFSTYAQEIVHGIQAEPEFVNFFKETRNRFPAWGAGTTTLFYVPAHQAGGIGSLESIPGLLKRLPIRALYT